MKDGAVIGPKADVQEFRTAMRGKLGLKRPVGAYEAVEDAGVCMLRALRGG